MINLLDTQLPTFDAQLAGLQRLSAIEDRQLIAEVAAILEEVQTRGDAALVELSNRFDQQQVSTMEALMPTQQHIDAAYDALSPQVRQALETAAERVRAYHTEQKRRLDKGDDWQYTDSLGNRLGQRIQPMQRIGIYAPGGKAAYPSTIIMTAIPARVAGVAEVIACVPAPGGKVNRLVLAAAKIAQVDQVYSLGGAQAIGAMAWGTESVPRVDKIVGPGNVYVSIAKTLVYGKVGIDMLAGPSELVILADEQAKPVWVIQDLLAQAEHDEMAQSILISDSETLLAQVQAQLPALLSASPRREIIARSLADRGALIKVKHLDEGIAVVNRLAPEHVQLALADPAPWLAGINYAGAVFLGHASAEVQGDYSAGPSHVLPTGGSARFASPLGVGDFQVRTSIIQASATGSRVLNRTAAVLAREEGLFAHAESAECRLKD